MAGRILRLKDMIAHTGLSRTVIYERMNEKSPRYAADFPKSFSLGGGAIGWFQSDVDAWLESCAATPRGGIRTKKVLATPGHKDLEMDAPSKQMTLASLPMPSNKLLQKHPPTPKPTNAQPATRRSTQNNNLAEAIVKGGGINDRLLHFLQMKTWTAPMAALLIAGIDPPLDCHEIPDDGIGLDDEPLHGSNARFHEARHILKEWYEWLDEQEKQIAEVEPIRFFFWCIDETIDTEWLRLFMELAGIKEESKVDLTTARFALLTNR